MNAPAKPDNTAVVPSIGPQAQLPFQLYESRPESITQHVIWDYELDKLVNISRPITLGLATTLGGAFLGLLPYVIHVVGLVMGQKVIPATDFVLAMVGVACLAGASFAGYFAYQGQHDAFEIRRAVRSRNIRPVNPPTQTA